MEFNLYCFSDYLFYTSRFLCQATVVMKLDVVNPVNAALTHDQSLWVIQPDVPVVLLDPDFSGMFCLFNVDLPTLIENALSAQCFHAEVILDGPKETDDLPTEEAYSFNVTCFVNILLMGLKVGNAKGKKTTDFWSSLGEMSLQCGLRA